MGKTHLKSTLLFSVPLILLAAFMVPMITAAPSAAAEPAGWYHQDSGTTVDLCGVAAADTSTAWAVGMEAAVLKTENGGDTWLAQDSGTDLDLSDISAVDASTAWVVGGSTGGEFIVLKTTSGGNTWHTVARGTGFVLTEIAAVDANTAWVAGASGSSPRPSTVETPGICSPPEAQPTSRT